MITVTDTSIAYSHGDTFAISFKVKNYALTDADTASFSIMDSAGTVQITAPGAIDITNSLISVSITATAMKALDVGKYNYDLNITNTSGYHQTLVYDKFVVKKVAHND